MVVLNHATSMSSVVLPPATTPDVAATTTTTLTTTATTAAAAAAVTSDGESKATDAKSDDVISPAQEVDPTAGATTHEVSTSGLSLIHI